MKNGDDVTDISDVGCTLDKILRKSTYKNRQVLTLILYSNIFMTVLFVISQKIQIYIAHVCSTSVYDNETKITKWLILY